MEEVLAPKGNDVAKNQAGQLMHCTTVCMLHLCHDMTALQSEAHD
jgi:hypothetical protein